MACIQLLETFIGDCFFAFPKAPSLKGLFLIACGPAQTEPAALRDIQDLVKRYVTPLPYTFHYRSH